MTSSNLPEGKVLTPTAEALEDKKKRHSLSLRNVSFFLDSSGQKGIF
jgi:hypothetical protein